MIDPVSLRAHYQRFLTGDRVLLTGHSHQAWPDVAREAMAEAYDDAARLVDDKWDEAVLAVGDEVRGWIANRIGARAEEIALAQNTHEVVFRFLSALDLRARPHLVTSGGEFHSMRRQLRRIEETGVEVSWVAPDPVGTLAERMAEAVRDDTAALLASDVLFETSARVPNLDVAVRAALDRGAEALVDAYHSFGVVPFSVSDFDERAFVTAGGYKYAQWGEGVCFLRVPAGCALRPVFTGWFSDFGSLDGAQTEVCYGARGADRFAGATYDAVSHYRARAVMRLFDGLDLSVERLRALSLKQTQRILERLEGFDIRTPRTEARGGFVAIAIENAPEIVTALRRQAIFTDARGDLLRLGPAPYVLNAEIDRALEALIEMRH